MTEHSLSELVGWVLSYRPFGLQGGSIGAMFYSSGGSFSRPRGRSGENKMQPHALARMRSYMHSRTGRNDVQYQSSAIEAEWSRRTGECARIVAKLERILEPLIESERLSSPAVEISLTIDFDSRAASTRETVLIDQSERKPLASGVSTRSAKLLLPSETLGCKILTAPPNEGESRMLTEKKAAVELGVAHTTLRTWRCRKKGLEWCKYLNGAIRYDLGVIERFKLDSTRGLKPNGSQKTRAKDQV
jgi:hypothetical protein